MLLRGLNVSIDVELLDLLELDTEVKALHRQIAEAGHTVLLHLRGV